MQFEGLEIAQEDVARKLCVLEAGEIVERLCFCRSEVPAGALLVDQQNAFPEQVDEAARYAQQLYWLLETGNAAAFDAKQFEQSL